MCEAKKGESKLIQFPFALALDSTQSQAKSRDLIVNMFKALKLTNALSYTLVTFNDCRDCLTYNPALKIFPTTSDYKDFLMNLQSVKFANGGDPKERLFAGKKVFKTRQAKILKLQKHSSKNAKNNFWKNSRNL